MIAESLLRCTVGTTEFAIRSGEVRHIARVDQLRADDTADGRAGSVKLGGQHIPVFELRQALRLGDTAPQARDDRHIAVTGDDHELVGWIVDRVTREPRDGNPRVAPLPPSVGGDACRWFEGVVTSTTGDVMLLVSPRHLNPLRVGAPGDDAVAAFAAPYIPGHAPSSEPVALVFSTPALPPGGVDKFALSGRQVAAIVQPADPLDVPGCAPHVVGLTFWRNVAVPIVDFRRSTPIDPARSRRLIARCARSGNSLIALPIEADVAMHRPAPDNRLVADIPTPPFATGVFDLHGDRVALIDLDAVLAGAA
ncbi:MAG: chemotaxis protein CheW [Cyanobacteria bacterium]|nr:chemotaxis protein CheW [Cyanobacteriota bacterium]